MSSHRTHIPLISQISRRGFVKGVSTIAFTASLFPASALAAFEATPEMARQIRFLGKKDAAITVAEYFSMTCGHCGNFHRQTFPSIKKELIDQGLIRFEMHPFPLDQLALQAHALCRVLPNESYFKMVDVLLNQQKEWLKASDPVQALKNYAKFAGISSANYDAIVNNRPFLEAIIDLRQIGTRKHQIQATPSFVVNGKTKFSGDLSYEQFQSKLSTFGI